jgi:hypothetical protein
MARQYNLNNLNGIHLKAHYDYDSYVANGVQHALIENYDLHPYRSNDLSDFEFINGSYRLFTSDSPYYGMPMGNGFIGENSNSTRNLNVEYTQFKKLNTLVKGEIYYTSFDMYFNFNGEAQNYEVNSTGYTINVNIYAIFGNNKKKLKLSNLRVYDYDVYSGSTDNPYSYGYHDVSTTFFNQWVKITGDTTLHVSYLPHPHQYLIENSGGSNITVSYIEGAIGYSGYATAKSETVSGGGGNLYITSFSTPSISSFGIPNYTMQDQGLAPEPNISPFNIMNGYMFRVTAELDASTKELFESNICTGNKDFKIIVDYNGTISQTTVNYVYDNFDIGTSVLPAPFF